MHMGTIATLQGSIIATGAVAERRFVGFDDAQAGAGAAVKAISAIAAEAGEVATVTYVGIVDMVAGGELDPGPIASDAAGQPVPLAEDDEVAGFALDAASAGGRVRVLIR